MNRVIKFRAWNTDDNKMEYPIVLGVCTNGILQPLIKCSDGNRAYKDYPLMQFTGLLDKNGNEIFEGDILKVSTLPISKSCIVRYEEFGFKPLNLHVIGGFPLEVIGNIYETPNLLTN